MERIFVVDALARARARTQAFDGPPVASWVVGRSQSLPPPSEPPKKAPKTTPLSHTAMRTRKNMVCVTTVEGKRKWTLDPQLVEKVRLCITGGGTTKAIASALNLPLSTVSRISLAMRTETAAKQMAQQRHQEPQRTFVIDWKSRLAAIEFSDPPEGVSAEERPQAS